MVNAYPQEALAGGRKLSFTKFAAFQYENRARAAEVMRDDGALDATCQAAAGGDACRVLKAWDGRSDKEYVWTHIFEEFVERLPATGIWKVPFASADKLNKPRAEQRQVGTERVSEGK